MTYNGRSKRDKYSAKVSQSSPTSIQFFNSMKLLSSLKASSSLPPSRRLSCSNCHKVSGRTEPSKCKCNSTFGIDVQSKMVPSSGIRSTTLALKGGILFSDRFDVTGFFSASACLRPCFHFQNSVHRDNLYVRSVFYTPVSSHNRYMMAGIDRKSVV